MRATPLLLACTAVVMAGRAVAWGELGHEITATIAYRHLTPATKVLVDGLLATDTDTLTARDFASRANWADKYRNAHPETAMWHYVDIEIDSPDLASACFGFPRLTVGQAASTGPARDCIVDKIVEFEAELRAPATPRAERLMAFKYLLHFVGDLHQPLHASDHFDRGGNCVGLAPSPDGHDRNLHAYWDIGAVEWLGNAPGEIAARLDEQISPGDLRAWGTGDVTAWAEETFDLSRKDAYALPSRPTCNSPGLVELTPGYQATARIDAATQLKKAGVRLAILLNRALSP